MTRSNGASQHADGNGHSPDQGGHHHGKWREIIDPKITVGNLLTAAAIAFSAIWWTSRQEARIDLLIERTLRLEKADELLDGKIKTVGDEAKGRLETLSKDMGEMKVTLKGIGTNLDWIVTLNGGKPVRLPGP